MYIYQFLSTTPGHQTHFTAFTHTDDEKSEQIFPIFAVLSFYVSEIKNQSERNELQTASLKRILRMKIKRRIRTRK